MFDDSSNKILIVEDDDVYRNGVKDMLSTNGYSVLLASDGEQGMESVLMHKPKLILLDLLLPKLHGFEVLKRLREYPDEFISKTPVIVLSNLSSPENVSEANKLGIAAYFVKSHTTPDTILRQIDLIFGSNTPARDDVMDFTKISYS